MMRASTLMIVAFAAACWRSSPPPPVEPTPPAEPPRRAQPPSRPPLSKLEEMMQTFEQFADDMCSCRDATCAQRVSDEMSRWSQDHAADQDEPPKMTEEDAKRAADIGVHLGECKQKAKSPSYGGQGSATP
jgi:hypothetical protein